MLAESIAERRGELALPAKSHVDAPQRERQRFAEVPEDDLQARVGIEDAADDQPDGGGGGLLLVIIIVVLLVR